MARLIARLIAVLTLALSVAGCSNPLSLEDCTFRVMQLPDESSVEAIHRTVPQAIRQHCGKRFRVVLYVL